MFNPKQLQFALKINRDIDKLINWVHTTTGAFTQEIYEMYEVQAQYWEKFVAKNVPEFQNKEQQKSLQILAKTQTKKGEIIWKTK